MENGRSGPVVVVGGGIGGTSAALALAHKGIRVLLLEQAPELREAGVGIQMPPNAFKMFERLGVLDTMLKKAALPKNLIFMDAVTGGQILRIPVGEAFVGRFGHPYAVMHRGDLLAVLADACRAEPLIEIQTAARVTGFIETEEGVRILVEDGRVFEGVAAIGCDGLRSTLRKQIIGPTSLRTQRYVIFRGVVPVEEMPPLELAEAVVMWGGPQCNFSHYPVRGGTHYALGASTLSSVMDDAAYDAFTAEQGAGELLKAFTCVCEPVKRLLDKIDLTRMWKLYDREPERNWTQGRVTLLGDAAHPTFNYMAQGACMALEDAVNLADVVAASRDFPEAFAAYQEGRYVRTARVQITSRLYGDLYHASGVAAEVRNQTLGKLSVPELYDHLAWLYDGI